MEALSLGIVDTCDQYNQTLYDFAASLFDSERDIPNRATHKALGCNLERVDDGWAIENCNFLIVDRMTVDVGYQGKGLGLRLLKHVFDTLGGSCGSAAMEPFPI
jgi:GNAT superfamily N-acetyltransferase